MQFKSEQEIYDYVGEFLIKQGKRSVSYGSCCYRGANGTKCAVGAVLSDHFYRKTMDEKNIPMQDLIINYKLPRFFYKFENIFIDLQSFHDHPDNWNNRGLDIEKLVSFGKILGLDTSKFDRRSSHEETQGQSPRGIISSDP